MSAEKKLLIEYANKILNRYDELTNEMANPEMSNRYMDFVREMGELTPKYEVGKKYINALKGLEEAIELRDSGDQDLHELALEEICDYEGQIEDCENQIRIYMTPVDERDERSVIVEIRAGAGGEEAALFAGTLYKMYMGYAANRNFSVSIVDSSETELGGYKEVIFEIKGSKAYSRLKYESGVHRVQRVPSTESGGRIHTSTCTVAVLPEATPADVVINPNDLRIDRYRASGAGGQHVNRTDSAIRITHLPTGLVVQCQDERSQIANKEKAMAVLQSRLWDLTRSQEKAEIDSDRKSQVGTGERSEKIRTYNYHQGRVTDHRIGFTLYKLEEILSGSLDEIIDALIAAAANEAKEA